MWSRQPWENFPKPQLVARGEKNTCTEELVGSPANKNTPFIYMKGSTAKSSGLNKASKPDILHSKVFRPSK